jgi:hypothetical protein
MRIADRRCCVCGCKADPSKTSAHVLRVLWFCTEHGQGFHASPEYHQAQTALSTRVALELVLGWCDQQRSLAVRELLAA